MIDLLTGIFMIILICIGAIYTTTEACAPIWERIQVFGVGFGMYLGVILLCHSYYTGY